MRTPIICIYHKDCVDGTSAAAVVLRKFPDAQCFPLGHSYTKEDFSVIKEHLVPETQVYIVDSTLGVKECEEAGCQVTVIDHHVSEHERMEEFVRTHENVAYIYDNEKSGASLCFSYFFPDETLPELLRYVEDSDLWKGTYGTVTKDVAHYLSTYRNDPSHIRELIDGNIETVKQSGMIISAYVDNAVSRLIQIPPILLRVGEHTVLAFNITDHESACGNILSTRHGQVVGLYTIKGDVVKISLRSVEGQNPSALTIAEALGGGGNVHTAATRIPLADFLERIDRK